MTPGQARVALLTFFLVTAGVVVNALFLQPGAVFPGKVAVERMSTRSAMPAQRSVKFAEISIPRGSSERSSREEALRIARFAADPSKINATAADPDEAADAETIRAIQRELKLRGYGPVPVDGTIGLATRGAIMAFEHDHGLVLSGEASEGLLKHMVLGAVEPASVSHASADRVSTAHAAEVILSVQQWLAALGYSPGPLDGRLGEETVKAIREFEMDKGLVPRGRVSAELAVDLHEAATATPAWPREPGPVSRR
jgi:peptidoglycan hydrolase-like protein with peptidoglycan-binding domain